MKRIWSIVVSIFLVINIVATIFIVVASYTGGVVAVAKNMIPLVLGYFLIIGSCQTEGIRVRTRLALLSYVLGSAPVGLFIGVFWVFDIYGFATGSSTAGLVFVVGPWLSVSAGVIVLLAAFIGILVIDVRKGFKQ